MPHRGPVRCKICTSRDSKYTCPRCFIPYCSVKCFKEHEANSCTVSGPIEYTPAPDGQQVAPLKADLKLRRPSEDEIPDVPILKPLTSLKWPYIPEGPSRYEDPLRRDEPKPLQLHQYQAVASSPAIRAALSSNPCLPPLLRKLDKLRGTEREEALEALLCVTPDRSSFHGQRSTPYTPESEEVKAFKQFAEGVERSVRGEKADVLGLDWVEGLNIT